MDGGRFDHDGYHPDGGFWFGVVDSQNRSDDSFADVLAAGEVEPNGVLLARPIFVDDSQGSGGCGSRSGEGAAACSSLRAGLVVALARRQLPAG